MGYTICSVSCNELETPLHGDPGFRVATKLLIAPGWAWASPHVRDH